MCISLLAETDPTRLAASLGLGRVFGHAQPAAPRIEAGHLAPVIRLGAGGRIIVELMRYSPNVARRAHLEGDPWMQSLLGRNHGLLVVQTFSEWTSAARLLALRQANIYDVNSAYNRVAGADAMDLTARRTGDRLLLGNFTSVERRPLLVPVLFDCDGHDQRSSYKFVLISEDPTDDVAMTGAAHMPLNLSPEAALTWLHVPVSTYDASASPSEQGDESRDLDLDLDLAAVLADTRAESFEFMLYKSA